MKAARGGGGGGIRIFYQIRFKTDRESFGRRGSNKIRHPELVEGPDAFPFPKEPDILSRRMEREFSRLPPGAGRLVLRHSFDVASLAQDDVLSAAVSPPEKAQDDRFLNRT